MIFKIGTVVRTLYTEPALRSIMFEPGEGKTLPFGPDPNSRRHVRRMGVGETVLVLSNVPRSASGMFGWTEVLAHDGVFYVDPDYVVEV